MGNMAAAPRARFSLPLLILSIAVLAGAAFYWQSDPCGPSVRSCSPSVPLTTLRLTGLAPLNPASTGWAAIYWIVAIPVAFGLVVVCFRRRRDEAVHALVALAAAILLVTLVVVVSPRIEPVGWARAGINLARVPDLIVRGLVGLLIVAAGLIIFAILERSLPLIFVALIFGGLAVLACLYDISNVTTFGLSPAGWSLANLFVPGGFLLLGAIGFALGEHGW